MSYKVGDKVLIEAEVKENAGAGAYKVDMLGFRNLWINENDIQGKVKTYEDGLNDAWELARKICGCGKGSIDGKTLAGIFGSYIHSGLLLDDFTYQQALAKIEAYEESKAIKKGNIVLNVREDVKAVIMDNAIAEGAWQVYTENGCVELWKECEFKKTGKTVDIEHLLEQIRGNE